MAKKRARLAEARPLCDRHTAVRTACRADEQVSACDKKGFGSRAEGLEAWHQEQAAGPVDDLVRDEWEGAV